MDLTAEEYCRQVEAYLCRKNDGHLVRIVGPAFEQVCGWSSRGVPIKVAYRGIDRYFERYYAKGPRRRPVRIEFCEADVLDVFDEWRRAVGVPAPAVADADAGAQPAAAAARQPSLPAHLDRLIARLTLLRGGADRSLEPIVDTLVRELDAVRAGAKTVRGEARQALVARLRELDAILLDAVRARCDAPELEQLASDADAELAPFRDRMPRPAYDQARRACIDRLLRERARLPLVTYE
jgi:hypothetical protein